MRSFRSLQALKLPAGHAAHDDVDPSRLHVPLSRAMVDCGVYVDGVRLPGKYTIPAAYERVHELCHDGIQGFVWVGLHEPDAQQMQSVAEIFGLHPLAVEDAVQAHQRPKLERYDDTLFLVLKTVNYVPHESVWLAREIVETGEIMVFVGRDFVVTVRHGEHSGLAEVRSRMDVDEERLRLGPYGVLHAIADHVVDSYLDVTSLMEVDVDSSEEETFSPGSRIGIEQIYLLKREVVELRRSVSPLSVALERINSDHQDLMSKEVLRYMRDVVDHQAQAADQIASYDDLLSSLVEAALAKTGMQQNTDMRKISAWVAMVSVPTLLAGIYGMNFTHMPELQWKWSYPVVLGVMATVVTVLYHNFRRNHWL